MFSVNSSTNSDMTSKINYKLLTQSITLRETSNPSGKIKPTHKEEDSSFKSKGANKTINKSMKP